MGDYYIGVDLGGTKILTALADKEGQILTREKCPTGADKGKNVIINNIEKTIKSVIQKAGARNRDIIRIGVGSPGPLSIDKGIIFENSNLSWQNVPIVALLEEKLDIEVRLENDANAAVLGEKYFGAGKNASNLIYVTISTGIGGGIIVNNRLLHGESGNAAEIGHMSLKPDGPLCGCGNYGCFETLASGKAIARMGREAVIQNRSELLRELSEGDIRRIDAKLVARAAYGGDKMAKEIYKQAGGYLGIGLANIINLFNPGLILLGGGVYHSFDLLKEAMYISLEKRVLDLPYKQVKICPAQLGGDTGVKGALAVAMEENWF